jgi:phosphotriesterase-related protein
LQLVRAVLDAGLEQHLVLSHDVCYRSDLATYGGLGYTAISSHLPAALREIGVTDEQLQRIMIDNPRRALTGAD